MVGKGRAPCCDKTKVKRGPWSPAEDLRLISFIHKHGHSNWRALPQQAGLLRCGKSCRLRWINYLRPDVKRGNFSPEEEETIIRMHKSMGNKWSKIASRLPGRTDNEIKNVWNTHLKKRLMGRTNGEKNQSSKDSSSRDNSSSSSASSSSCVSYGGLPVGIYEAQESSVASRGTHEEKQGGQFSSGIFKQAQEESLSPGHSNISSNVQSLTGVEEVSMPIQETTALIQSNVSVTSHGQVQNRMTYDQAKLQVEKVSDEKIEMPLDSDSYFWSLLDSLNPIQPCEYQAQEHEVSKQVESTDFGEAAAEYKQWLKYFENELGLTEGIDNGYPEKDAEEELAMKDSENDDLFKPEMYPATSYFSMWSPPAQDFGI